MHSRMRRVVKETTCRFSPRKRVPIPILQAAEYTSGTVWKGAENLTFQLPLPLPPDLEPRNLHSVAMFCTDYALPVHSNMEISYYRVLPTDPLHANTKRTREVSLWIIWTSYFTIFCSVRMFCLASNVKVIVVLKYLGREMDAVSFLREVWVFTNKSGVKSQKTILSINYAVLTANMVAKFSLSRG